MATAAPSPLASSVEKTNGAKLSRLLIDGGTTVARNVFDSYHPPANLAVDLNANYSTLKTLLKKRVLRKPQWDKLFPPGGVTPDSNTFDITLLFLLLTSICGLSPPPSGWHTKPPPSDTSLEANLARIKFFRNELYGHVSTTGVDTPTFTSLWLEISAVLVALGLDQVEIDRLKAEHSGEEGYLSVLFDWADSEEDIKSQLKEVHQIVDTVRQIQVDDGKTLQQIKSKLKRVCRTQTKMHRDVLDVRQDNEDSDKKRENDRVEELLKILAKSEFKGDIDFHAERYQEGTREWIFKKVEDWLDDKTSPNRVMVISGNAGMGKSVVSAVVCKRMQEAGRLSGSHFCQHNNARYRNPQLMLQSLASHLCHALPEYKIALLEQLSRNLGADINNMGVEELFALLFKEPLSTISDPGRNTIIVIDALDESEYNGRNELLNVIANHFGKLPLWIRFLMTTRPEVNIADSLKGLQPLQMESNGDDNKGDIRLFFEKQLSQVIPTEDQDSILNALVEKSEGVILYAYFLVEFIEKNVSLLTPKYFDSSLPLGISSVYQSYFKRLEKEFRQELELDEDKFLGFLSAVMAAKEPLPLGFISNMFGFRAISSHRKVKKAISCISTLLPVRDGRLHIFHKSVKDWLTDASCYGQHEFTVDKKEGCQILSTLCETELDVMKRNGIHGAQFSDTEKYALQHGVQHMLEVMGDHVNPQKLKELVENYVTDLELMYAKLCLGDTAGSGDVLNITKQKYLEVLPTTVQCSVTTALSVMRKHKHVLRRQPQHFFQAILNEGGQEFASKASLILQNRYPEIPYIEILKKEDSEELQVEGRFDCESLVACFDVSPQMDYMVCECFNRSIQLWSLQSGDRRWMREAMTVKPYGSPALNKQCALREAGNFFHHEENREQKNMSLSFYRSVVFHPNGEWVLPGRLKDVFTINGDLKPLFPTSNCSFTVCAFSGDKSKMLTDCPDNPEHVIMWDMSEGAEIARFQRKKNLSSFAFSPDGTMVAISDCSQYTGLYKVDNLNCELLCETRNPWWTCGLMHFSPDGQDIVCGYLKDDWRGQIHYFNCDVPTITELEGTGEGVFNFSQGESNVSCWPWEFKSLDEGRFLFLELGIDETLIRSLPWTVYRSLKLPSFSSISKKSLLVGSPFSKEVFMINLRELKKCDEEEFQNIVRTPDDVAISVDGKYRYIWRSEIYDDYIDDESDHHEIDSCDTSFDDNSFTVKVTTVEVTVEVNVYNEEKICQRHDFKCPSVFLIPVREGVLLLAGNDKLELRDFELSRCVRTFSEVDCVKTLFPVSEDLVGCLAELDDDCWKVNILSVASAEIVLTTSVQGDVTSIACNSQFQFVACTYRENRSYDDNDNVVVTIAVWNKRHNLWKRNIIIEFGGYNAKPSALITRNNDLVVTWKTLDEGAGVHILNATTGVTLHKLLTDQSIIGCTFLSDGKHFVCSSGDIVVRLFNVHSGELISSIDIETYPYCLAACLNQPLFAVGCEDYEIQFFRVHVQEVKESERKDKRLVCTLVVHFVARSKVLHDIDCKCTKKRLIERALKAANNFQEDPKPIQPIQLFTLHFKVAVISRRAKPLRTINIGEEAFGKLLWNCVAIDILQCSLLQ